MAAATVSVAHRSGLEVPGDISITGFDDTALATSIWPELTTIRQPIAAMAEAALDLLLAHLGAARGKAYARERVLDFEFVIRDSAGPPRSEEHTSELQSLMRISYAVLCLKKKTHETARA